MKDLLPPHLQHFINGCDSFPDGIGPLSWKHCCDLHDISYTIGGSPFERVLSDFNLGTCVWNEAGLVGVLMCLGVLTFGWLFYNFNGGPNVITQVRNLFRRNSP